MIRTDRLFPRMFLVGALAAALAAGGCGRKGGLDAPPNASVAGTAVEADQQGAQGSQNTLIGRSDSGLPRIRGEDKRIPLDALLN